MTLLFCFNQKTAYEFRISDWSSDVCSSDLGSEQVEEEIFQHPAEPWRPIATPEQSTPGSSDGSWTCIAATLARKQFGAAGGAELPQAPSASLLSRSEELTYELQSPMRISYAVFCLKKKKQATC